MFTDNPFKTYRKEMLEEGVSKKHFQMVADAIKAHPDLAKRQELAKHHADIFATQNPRFDHGRFYDACDAKGHVKDIKEAKEVHHLMQDGKSVDTFRDHIDKKTAQEFVDSYNKSAKKNRSNIRYEVKTVSEESELDEAHTIKQLKQARDDHNSKASEFDKRAERESNIPNIMGSYIAKMKKKSYKHIKAANVANKMLDKDKD